MSSESIKAKMATTPHWRYMYWEITQTVDESAKTKCQFAW